MKPHSFVHSVKLYFIGNGGHGFQIRSFYEFNEDSITMDSAVPQDQKEKVRNRAQPWA